MEWRLICILDQVGFGELRVKRVQANSCKTGGGVEDKDVLLMSCLLQLKHRQRGNFEDEMPAAREREGGQRG